MVLGGVKSLVMNVKVRWGLFVMLKTQFSNKNPRHYRGIQKSIAFLRPVNANGMGLCYWTIGGYILICQFVSFLMSPPSPKQDKLLQMPPASPWQSMEFSDGPGKMTLDPGKEETCEPGLMIRTSSNKKQAHLPLRSTKNILQL